MSTSWRGIYCTARYEASLSVRAPALAPLGLADVLLHGLRLAWRQRQQQALAFAPSVAKLPCAFAGRRQLGQRLDRPCADFSAAVRAAEGEPQQPGEALSEGL